MKQIPNLRELHSGFSEANFQFAFVLRRRTLLYRKTKNTNANFAISSEANPGLRELRVGFNNEANFSLRELRSGFNEANSQFAFVLRRRTLLYRYVYMF